MIFFRRTTPEEKLTQAQRDLRDVQQQLEELKPQSLPFGSNAARRFAQLTEQLKNLNTTISHLQQQVGHSPLAA